jgi:predicted dehydrogenase
VSRYAGLYQDGEVYTETNPNGFDGKQPRDKMMNMKRNLLMLVLTIAVGSLPGIGRAEEEEVIRLGMIGLDTSHVIAFTRYINDPKNKTGCRVVAGYPGGSPDFPASANRVDKFTEELRDKFGLEIVDSIEELCDKVDGILLESVDGRPHLEQARIAMESGKPLFVDKPVADDLADVIELFRLAKEKNVPCWSSSAMRFGEGVADARNNEKLGQIVSCDVFGSSSWAEQHPSLYLYGIHAVEPLFTVMGTGCESVRRIKTDEVDLVVGVWKGSRIGTFRDLRGGKTDFQTIIYGKNSMVTCKSSGYAPLLVEIVKFFKTGKPPVSPQETIEIYAFMSAADESEAQGGAPISIAEVTMKAEGKQ